MVNKFLLIQESEFFQVFFSTDRWSSEVKCLKCVEPTVLAVILNFLHEGADLRLNDDNVLDILQTADYLLCARVSRKCQDYLISQLAPENAVGFFRFSCDLPLTELNIEARAFIAMHFREVCNHDEIYELPEDYLINILSSDILQVKEVDVWHCIITWSGINQKAPSEQLMKTVRYGLIDKQVFRRFIGLHPLMQESEIPKVVDRFQELVDVLPTVENTVRTPMFARPRDAVNFIMSFGGWSIDGILDNILIYNPKFDVWMELQTRLPFRGANSGVTFYQDAIYILGWKLWRFDLNTFKMNRLSTMIHPRDYAGLVTVNNNLYAVGGSFQNIEVASCERYDLERNQWFNTGDMRKVRCHHALVVHNDNIFAIGGFGRVQCHDTIEVYDSSTGQWTLLGQRMRSRRCAPAAAVINNKIYIVGGWNSGRRLDSCEILDLDTLEWSTMPSLNIPRSHHSLQYIDGKLVCLGGHSSEGVSHEMETYDFETGRWTLQGAVPSGRSRLGTVLVPATAFSQQFSSIVDSKREFVDLRRKFVRGDNPVIVTLNNQEASDDGGDEDAEPGPSHEGGGHHQEEAQEGPLEEMDLEDQQIFHMLFQDLVQQVDDEDQLFIMELDADSDQEF